MATILARLKNWKTTATGLVIGGIFVAVFRSFGCQLPTDWLAWAAGLLPVILGGLAND